MHGPGQNPKSLLAQLDAAIDRGDAVFNMSGGEQLRDYLPVSQVAADLAMITESPRVRRHRECLQRRTDFRATTRRTTLRRSVVRRSN